MSNNIVSIAPKRVDLTDAPARLRRLADDLERECTELGALIGASEVQCRVTCVVRISRAEPAVYAFGTVENLAQAYMDLHAGAQQMLLMPHPERGQ